jgi:hypothetical protein
MLNNTQEHCTLLFLECFLILSKLLQKTDLGTAVNSNKQTNRISSVNIFHTFR